MLALTSVCAFGGCGGGKDSDLYSGIVISEEKEYSQETEAYAETVIFSMLKYATQKQTGIVPNDITNKKIDKIKNMGVFFNIFSIFSFFIVHHLLSSFCSIY